MHPGKRLSVFAAVSALLLFALPARAAELKELARGVYAMVGGNGRTNSGFVVTGDGVVVIDTQGPRPLAEELRSKIREVTDKPVAFVVNTHYHGDHTFGNQLFGEGVVIAHERTREALIERDEAHRAMFRRFFGADSLEGFRLTLPEVTFTERLTLKTGGRTIELVYAGGRAHTGGDIFVWLPEERVVFAGDLLYSGRLPLLDDGDSSGALAAIGRLSSTGAEVFVPGHGSVGGPEALDGYKGYLEALRVEVGRMYSEGRSLEEVKSGIRLPRYSSYLMYGEWLPANAAKVYMELKAGEGAPR